ncbi:MAG: WbqC family protein [Lewinella sp.]|nr:WbqC family protein [Lewinella sp.]
MTETLLNSTVFFPPISGYVMALRCGKWHVEAQEPLPKRGFRYRSLIATANGPLYLSIPLEKGKYQSTPVRAVRISQESKWRSALQHQFNPTKKANAKIFH